MIKSLTAINPKGEELKLILREPDKSGLILTNVDGLGPPKATINSTEIASVDGGIYNSARAQIRNIVITLRMMNAPTIEDSRQKTYRYFQVKSPVKLLVETDNRYAEISGYVESNTPVIFSKEESTVISILCPDPWFYEVGDSRTIFSGVRPMFEFPFPTEGEDLNEFGEILLDTNAELDYIGDVETGVLITVQVLGECENIRIFNADTLEQMIINTSKIAAITGAEVSFGDEILISTYTGKKYVRLRRNAVETNIISSVGRTTSWFTLTPGLNMFGFTADQGAQNLLVTFSYRNAYGGI